MRLGLCCCGGLIPCFGCGNKRFQSTFERIGVEHSGFSGFQFSSGQSVSCSGTESTILGEYSWSGTQYFVSPNDIPTNLQLWRQPEGVIKNGYGYLGLLQNRCQWIWNDLTIYKTVGHRVAVRSFLPYLQVHSQMDVIGSYAPVNAVDPADPWNKEIELTDSRCNQKVIESETNNTTAVRWECYSMPVYTALLLSIQPKVTGNEVQHFWDLRVFVTFGTTAVTNRSWTGRPENDPFDAVAPFVRPFVNGTNTPVTGPTGPYPCFPFFQTPHPYGAGFVAYRKEVKCNEDFNREPVVLELDDNIYIPRRYTVLGITCPQTITLTLFPE
jgi:hypothetical protein